MDEILDVAELAADAGLEEAFAWLLRIVGVLLILAGIGVWLFADVTVLVPAGLVVAGIVALVAPEVLLFLLELT